MAIKAVELKIMGTETKPSRPSVRLVALADPTTTIPANKKYKVPILIDMLLNGIETSPDQKIGLLIPKKKIADRTKENCITNLILPLHPKLFFFITFI